jgi:hypothetical protein
MCITWSHVLSDTMQNDTSIFSLGCMGQEVYGNWQGKAAHRQQQQCAPRKYWWRGLLLPVVSLYTSRLLLSGAVGFCGVLVICVVL